MADGGLGSAGLVVGFGHLRGLFFCDSVNDSVNFGMLLSPVLWVSGINWHFGKNGSKSKCVLHFFPRGMDAVQWGVVP